MKHALPMLVAATLLSLFAIDSRAAIVTLYSFENNLADTAPAGGTADNLSVFGAGRVESYAPGIVGQAVKIGNGATEAFRLRAVDSNDLDLAANFTLEAYVKPDSNNTGEWDRFWTKWGDGGSNWHWAFRYTNNGLDFFENGAQRFDGATNPVTNSVPLNRWSHVALVGDGTMLRGYINGVEVVSAAYTAPTAGAGAMNFGNFDGSPNTLQFTGLIDEAAIHNVALTPAELRAKAALAQVGPISINFNISGNDNNSVDADESAVVGNPKGANIPGTGWNNVLLDSTNNVAPATFTAATQGGNHIDLVADDGIDSGANLTSSGAFFTNFADVTDNATNRGLQGEAGLMQSILLLNSSESVTISNLPANFTEYGYKVLAYFDIGNSDRVYGLALTDGNSAQMFFTHDTPTDSDADEDGLIEWLQATGTTAGAATLDANFAVFTDLNGSSFTITGLGTAGRSALSGLQIIPNGPPVPEPATAALGLLSLVGLMLRRRSRLHRAAEAA